MIIRDCINDFQRRKTLFSFMHLRCPLCKNEELKKGEQTYWIPDANSMYAGLSAERYLCNCGWAGDGREALVHVGSFLEDDGDTEAEILEYVSTFDHKDRPKVPQRPVRLPRIFP